MVLVRPDWWYRRQVHRYRQHRAWWLALALVSAAAQSAAVWVGGWWFELAALTTGAPVVFMTGWAYNHGALRAIRLFAPHHLRPGKEPDAQ